jgi:hypothetical protein
MVRKFNKKLKVEGKATAVHPDAKSNPKRKAPGGLIDQAPKKACSEKFCKHCKAHGCPYQMHNTSDCHCYDNNGEPLGAAVGKPSDAKKPLQEIWMCFCGGCRNSTPS